MWIDRGHRAAADCKADRLGGRAFHRILIQKQTKYRDVLAWLEGILAEATAAHAKDLSMLEDVARRGDRVFASHRY